MIRTKRIALTGAAGQINYNLLFRIASGELFGHEQHITLQLLELPAAMNALKGVLMELEDCAFPLIDDIIVTDDPNVAVKDTECVLLVGSKPRGPGMKRADLIRENGPIFVTMGRAINEHAADNVRVLTVGNPCNTNCLITMENAPDVPRDRFHALSRLDQNRAVAQLADKSGVPLSKVSHMIVWGNHSASMVPDYRNARINGIRVPEIIQDLGYLQSDFIKNIGERGAEIIGARGKSSAASAASAVIDHMHSILKPTPALHWFSAGVCSDGNPYGIPDGLIFSFPCRSDGLSDWHFVPELTWDEFLRERIRQTTQELLDEKELVKDLLNKKKKKK